MKRDDPHFEYLFENECAVYGIKESLIDKYLTGYLRFSEQEGLNITPIEFTNYIERQKQYERDR